METLSPVVSIVNKIIELRGEKVLIDRDLAELYDVETKLLKRAVRRHINRFPEDFMFQLSKEEFQNLRSHFGTSSWGGTRYMPLAFTELGVAMLSSVLNSERAIEVNIGIMRAFAHFRKMIASHDRLAKKLTELEHHLENHDEQIKAIFEAIRQLVTTPERNVKKIGFTIKENRRHTGGKQKRNSTPSQSFFAAGDCVLSVSSRNR